MLKKLLLVCLFFTSALFVHAETPEVQTPQQIEKEVREYFSDTPVMIEIARCESKFRQFTDAGNVFHGGYGGQMIGVFQFYEAVHAKEAKRLGHDLNTVEGNLAYAQYLYDESGTTPWNSSRACWEIVADNQSTEAATTATSSTSLTKAQMLEKIALLKQLIQLLQTLLALQ